MSDEDDEALLRAAGEWAEKQDHAVTSQPANDKGKVKGQKLGSPAGSKRHDSERSGQPREPKAKKRKKKQNLVQDNEHNTPAHEQTAARVVAKDKVPQLSASNTNKTAPFSVHVTQVSYDATLADLRTHFQTDIVRMVRRGTDGTFSGVAFCDYRTEAEYDRALALHRTTWMGRAINVRPVRTPEELQLIVLGRGSGGSKQHNRHSNSTANLSKKQRNRRAAIIRGRKKNKNS